MKKSKWVKEYTSSDVKKVKNKTIARLAPKTRKCAVLDGYDAKTTKALVKAGMPVAQIYLPNHSDDFHKLAKKYTNASHESMGEFLQRNEKAEFGTFDLDYMTFLEGSQEAFSTPIDDLKTIFNNHMVCDKSVVALTLALNHHKNKWSDDVFYPEVFQAISLVTKLARKHGYTAELEEKPGIYANYRQKKGTIGKAYRVRGTLMYCLIFRIFKVFK